MLDESREAIVAIIWQYPASSVPLLISCTYLHIFMCLISRESDDSSRDFSESPSPQSAPSVQGRMLG